MRFINYLNEQIDSGQITSFLTRWNQKLSSSFGLTDIEASAHWLRDRVNDTRNVPPIKIEELDFVLDMFFSKMGTQFRKDVDDVKKNIAKKRGKRKQDIPPNEIEYAIKSISTKIALVIVLKQQNHAKNTAIIRLVTIMRKKGFGVNKGVEVVVERKTFDEVTKFELLED